MDGRIQLPVIQYLQNRFSSENIDNITEAGPVGILVQENHSQEFKAILRRVRISIRAHGSDQLAIVAHHDCAGNPLPDAEQVQQVQEALSVLEQQYPAMEIIGLWLDENCEIHEIEIAE
jgi:hypothetical protein